jgi:PAS domain S-box-containing protein
VRRDGSWIDTLVSASPVVDEQGDFAGSFAMVTDITERKRMEYELQLSQFCIDKAFIGIFRGGPDARIRFVNEYGARMLGYSQEELLSMSFFDIDTCLTPQWWEEHRRNLTAAGSAKFETVHRRKDGTTFPVEVTVNYLKYHDYEFSCSFSQDITERKRTESVMSARMRLLEFAATHTLDELLEATLNEAEELTGSCIGFYHYLEPDQKTLSLQNWSTRTKKDFCRAEGKGRHYDVSAAGVWVDCIHQRRPVIHNDYDSLPHRKGLPPGHAPVTRELVVPVFRGDSIVAVFGVGNKSHDYTPQDVETVSLLTDLAWGIAGQKRVEDALRASEWKYRAIIEHAPFGISRSTRDGRLLSANPAMAGILKYDSPEELLETVNRSSVQDVLFEDPSLRDILVERIFAGSSWHVFENRYRCKDGSVITCKVHSRRILGKEGGGRVFESFLENITERLEAEKALRESEEKFRVLAETSPTAIFLYQGEMIVYANPATERLFGYGADELLRMRFWDWAHDDFRELVRDRGLARLRGEPVPGQYESRFVTRAGEDRWLVVAAGLIDYHGRATGVASFLDITEIKKAEEQVRSSLAEKEILLKEVHHRVKNNLQIISSLLDLQSDYILEEHSRRFIRESQDRIRSMALVHEQLYKSEDLAFIDFARYVDELVTSLCQSCMVSQERVRVRVAVRDIELGIDEAIPCGLIINELVSNALKHAFPGDTRGEVFIRGAMGEEGVVCLSVADSGVGLPPGLDFLNTESLGLQIVNLLTSQLRGTIDMQGDKGVTVTICFRVNPKG